MKALDEVDDKAMIHSVEFHITLDNKQEKRTLLLGGLYK